MTDARAREIIESLTPMAICCMALVPEGFTNKEIGEIIGTSAQVVKNYLSRVYNVTGLDNRLEVAVLLTITPNLAEPARTVLLKKLGDKKMKDILSPVNTTDSSSPSIRRAAEEPANWRAGGETDPKKAIADSKTKHPIDPSTNK